MNINKKYKMIKFELIYNLSKTFEIQKSKIWKSYK